MLCFGFLAILNVHLLLFSYSPVVNDVANELRLTNAEAGFVFSISILALMLFRIPWGIIFDRKGFKTTLMGAFMFIGTFGFLRGLATNYMTLVASQFLLGIGLSAIMPAIPRLVSIWCPKNKIGVATGVCLAGFPIGDFVALGLTPLIVYVLGSWHYAFQVYGLWCLAFVPILWRFSRSEPKRETFIATPNSSSKSFVQLLRMKEVWLLTGLYFCAGVFISVFLAGFCTVGVLNIVLPVIVEMPQLSPFLSSILGIVASAGNIRSFLLPTLIGQLRDVSGTFLSSMLFLAVVGELMFVLGLLLPEIGGKRKTDS